MPLDADSIAEELRVFQRRYLAAMQSLQSVPSLSTGAAAHEVVYQEAGVRLLHYLPAHRQVNTETTGRRNKTPLVIVYALINRAYILDLRDGRSFIQALLAEGQDVYLLDWVAPGGADYQRTLADYISGMVGRCVDEVCRRHHSPQINLLGVCQGGVFSLCYTALFPQKIKNLVTMVTPVDFQAKGCQLGALTRRVDIDPLVKALGNIPGGLLGQFFASLRPHTAELDKYLQLIDGTEDEQRLQDFILMEGWVADCPDQAGAAFRQFAGEFVQQNRLLAADIVIGDGVVDLSRIRVPVLNIYAQYDHLVPPAASQPLSEAIGSEDYTAREFVTGHIGIFVSMQSLGAVPEAIAAWLNARS